MAATAAPTTPELFIEQSIGPVRVDRAGGILRGIKICGLRSKNGRRYTEAALRKAVRLYEGAKVNIDHLKPGESCPADKRLGHLEEVYWSDTPTKGLYGNLRFPPDHPKAAWLCSVAEHTPNDLGMSHRASAGEVSFDGKGEPIVESISEVESVDLVADPATVGGLFEEVDPTRKPPMKKAVQALLEAAALFPIQKVPLKELVDDSALATALAEEIEVAEAAAPVDAAKTAFGSLAAHLMVTGAPAAAFAQARPRCRRRQDQRHAQGSRGHHCRQVVRAGQVHAHRRPARPPRRGDGAEGQGHRGRVCPHCPESPRGQAAVGHP
jgi:hypothetical protein